ncbi:hypothetical protein LCGC14_1369190 [marine sediment metagenome]|uniref:ParB-like N-terminal domain-containing protein n=1 Tax=marine sediment metagenome TaxID=412755 RepID=A0A0F9K692_9ZZZZ
MSTSLRSIKITDIRENPVALRAVDRESEAFVGLRDSIALVGIMNPINVRERTEVIEGQTITYYELCDGLHRYTAAVDVGITELNVQILTLDDADVLEAQVMANVHKIDTKPVQYTQQMNRIFAGNPAMTISDMAAKLAKSPSWVSQRLGLLKLEKGIAELVDDGKITISNAVVLAKLPHEEQVNFVTQLSLSARMNLPHKFKHVPRNYVTQHAKGVSPAKSLLSLLLDSKRWLF